MSGAAVFGYVNGQAGVSEASYANSVGVNNNFLAEKFKVVDLNFPASNQIGFWIYNTGSISLQVFQVRVSDSAGLINLLYNYTKSGQTKTDYVFDLRSSLASKCKTAASSYESPLISGINTNLQIGQSLTVTIPLLSALCPSFGQTTSSGTSYSVTVVGLYGNSVRYYQTK